MTIELELTEAEAAAVKAALVEAMSSFHYILHVADGSPGHPQATERMRNEAREANGHLSDVVAQIDQELTA